LAESTFPAKPLQWINFSFGKNLPINAYDFATSARVSHFHLMSETETALIHPLLSDDCETTAGHK